MMYKMGTNATAVDENQVMYRKERDSFIAGLRRFHASKG